VFGKDVIDILFGDLTTIFGKSLFQVFFCDFTTIVNIKLVEDGRQSFIAEILSYIDRSCNKLTIVNSFVLREIQFLDNVVDFLLSQIHVGILDDFFQLLNLEESTMICVNFFKFFPQLSNLIGFKMLDKHIDRCLFKERLSSKGLHSSEYFLIQLLLVSMRHTLVVLSTGFKPWMMQSI